MLLATLALVPVLVGASELVARVVFERPPDRYLRHPLLGVGWAPNHAFERLSIDDPPVRFTLEVNPLGFRGRSLRIPEKQPGTYRIFFLGASTTENAMLPEERTFPGRVEATLQAKFGSQPRVEVANTGVAGSGIGFALGMLVHRVLPLEPDLVVVLEGHNELMRSLERDWTPYSLPRPDTPPTFKDWLVGKSRLLAVLDDRRHRFQPDDKRRWFARHRAERRATPFTAPAVPVNRGVGRFRAQLRRLALLCEDAGAVCVFMTQPSLYQEPMPRTCEDALVGAVVDGQNLETKDLARGLEAYNEAVREVGRERGCLLVDLEREIPKDLDHFIDDVHLTSRGNEAVAAAVLRVVLASGTLPRHVYSQGGAR
jgi:lysophospholipase L1-like esterase